MVYTFYEYFPSITIYLLVKWFSIPSLRNYFFFLSLFLSFSFRILPCLNCKIIQRRLCSGARIWTSFVSGDKGRVQNYLIGKYSSSGWRAPVILFELVIYSSPMEFHPIVNIWFRKRVARGDSFGRGTSNIFQ